MHKNPTDGDIRNILVKSKTVAVVGLSANSGKDSNRVARYLMEEGYRIIPVNPAEVEILGQKSYKDLLSIPDKIDIVNVFRRSEFLPAIVEEAAGIKPVCIWAQLGVVDEGAASYAADRGMTVVMDRCIMIEHRRLKGILP